MAREAFVLGPAVVLSIGIMSWIIWSERPLPPEASVPETPPAASAAAGPASPAVPTVNQNRVAELQTAIQANPEDVPSLLARGHALLRGPQLRGGCPVV